MKTLRPKTGSARYSHSERSPGRGNTGSKSGREARSENSRTSKFQPRRGDEPKGGRYEREQKQGRSFERNSTKDFEKRPGAAAKPFDRERSSNFARNERPIERKPRYSDTDKPAPRWSRSSDNEKSFGRSTESRPFEREKKFRSYDSDRRQDRSTNKRVGPREGFNPNPETETRHSERRPVKSSDRSFADNREFPARGRHGQDFKEGRTFSGRASGDFDRPLNTERRKFESEGSPVRKRRYNDEHEGRATYRDGGRNTRFSERDAERTPRLPKNARKQWDDTIRLNKYIANSGVCSRREADELIKNGAITVNGKIVTEMGVKVKLDDVIMYGDERLRNEKKVYILLNKPKDYITTSEDPQERRIVTDLVRNACKERVFPVGRLDRNTTGLLLLTNDGDVAKKLSHPRHGVRKLYHVHLDKPLTRADLDHISQGVKLDGDTMVKPDNIAFVEDAESKKEVGIEIHSGQNRVVRRIFEHFGYQVTKLDRVMYAGLTKKDLPRGKYRFLTEKEISFLKMLK